MPANLKRPLNDADRRCCVALWVIKRVSQQGKAGVTAQDRLEVPRQGLDDLDRAVKFRA